MALFYSMPGYVDGTLSCKIITTFNNSAKGLDNILANVLIFDSNTGQMKAIVAGNELTGRRTAAATAVAAKTLKKEWPKPRTLAIFGAGRQAYTHVHALTKIYKVGTDVEIRIWNRNAKRAQEMAAKLKAEGFKITAMPATEQGGKDCARNAEMIVTATPSKTPVLKGAWVKPGALVNLVGHYDVDEDLYRKSVIYTDTKAAAVTELAHVTKLGFQITGEIGQIIAGTLPPPPPVTAASKKPITIFHSLGMAVEDSVAAQIVFDEYSK